MATPILIVAILLGIDLYVGPEDAVVYLAYVFAFTALIAVAVSTAITAISYKAWKTTLNNHNPESATRLIAFSKLLVNGSLLFVHVVFLMVGLGAVYLPVDSVVRLELTRLGLVEGQLVLLALGLSVYVLHHHIRKDILEQTSTEETLSQKMDDAAAVATERHGQSSDEHYIMLKRTKEAAEKSVELAEKHDEKLDEISNTLDNK